MKRYLALLIFICFFQSYSMDNQELFGKNIQLNGNQLINTQPDKTLFTYDQIVKLKKKIKEQPRTLLIENQAAQRRYYQAVLEEGTEYMSGKREGKVAAPLMNQTIIEEHKKNPLCFLSECLARGCQLTRFRDFSFARDQFTRHTARELYKILEKNNEVSVVSVGSGDLFQDLAILTQGLEEHSNKKIFISLIDNFYKYYLKAMKGKNRWDSQQFDYTEDNVQRTHARLTQFYQFLAGAFPGLAIQCYIFKNVEDYVAQVKNQNELKADIYLGIDLDKSFYVPRLPDYVKFLSSKPDEQKFKNGHEAYLSAPIKDIIKPEGIGLFLTKDCLDQAPFATNLCLKLLQKDAEKPEVKKLINRDCPKLGERFFILENAYRSPIGALLNFFYTRPEWFRNNSNGLTAFTSTALLVYCLYCLY